MRFWRLDLLGHRCVLAQQRLGPLRSKGNIKVMITGLNLLSYPRRFFREIIGHFPEEQRHEWDWLDPRGAPKSRSYVSNCLKRLAAMHRK
jgi:hypothetical protein